MTVMNIQFILKNNRDIKLYDTLWYCIASFLFTYGKRFYNSSIDFIKICGINCINKKVNDLPKCRRRKRWLKKLFVLWFCV